MNNPAPIDLKVRCQNCEAGNPPTAAYCWHCRYGLRAELQAGQIICPHCRMANFSTDPFCWKCRAQLHPPATQIMPAQPVYPQPMYYPAVVRPKDRSIAIILAVFFGFWTWLYTYRQDAFKFWMAVGLNGANAMLVFLTFGLWGFLAWLVPLVTWVCPIVDVAIRPGIFYADTRNWS